jgi:predicted transcriptional regulator
MSIAELKQEIHKIVDASNDENFLESYHQMLIQHQGTISWDELSKDEQDDILESERQIESGEFIDNEVVMDKLAKWISK